MVARQAICNFAVKWKEKFNEQNTTYLELVERYMGEECAALGFEMDCGHAFEEQYGMASHDVMALRGVIDEVTDIALLGSAVFSRWRYFNHWAYSGDEILAPKNREWFIVALTRLEELASSEEFAERGM